MSKVVEKNDGGGYLTYSLNDIDLDEKKNGMADVVWPDGTMESVKIVSVKERAAVWGYGVRPDTITRYKLMIEIEHHETKALIPLANLEVENIEQD